MDKLRGYELLILGSSPGGGTIAFGAATAAKGVVV